jgi:hypothetical protein
MERIDKDLEDRKNRRKMALDFIEALLLTPVF